VMATETMDRAAARKEKPVTENDVHGNESPEAANDRERKDSSVAANDGRGKDESGTAATAVPLRPAETAGSPAVASRFGGGRFKEDFSDGGHLVKGLAGIFKSTSGWQDGKYYALINDIPVGTIVKITDQSNGNIVYAKVLGQLPDMKESAGLTVRLSNAAAAEMAEGESKFRVEVSY
ncbi:MAG TPA: hypothetical protein VGR89_04150, partial [Puia sp.]|nr:hypothetical protein [Puia sp.]